MTENKNSNSTFAENSKPAVTVIKSSTTQTDTKQVSSAASQHSNGNDNQAVATNGVIGQSSLIEVDKALQSMRDSGFDLPTASGEIFDNSIEGGATIIRVRPVENQHAVEVQAGAKGKTKTKIEKHIEAIAFADNGMGIRPDILANTLKLGFSTRYNQRNGMGRFGMGMKLASINLSKRVEIYTRPVDDNKIYHTYLDLKEVEDGEQTNIVSHIVDSLPTEFTDMMTDPKTGEEFESGTLVIWSKVDRISDGGKYGTGVDQKFSELKKFIGRAYRKFMDQGIYFEVSGQPISAYDPLFLMENERATEELGGDYRAADKEESLIEIDSSKIEVTVTLYPKETRLNKGEGGKKFKSLYIPENEGRVSILRNGREIFYDIIPRLFPDGVQVGDRFIGVEVSFPATLDEYFQVRNVKRGAEPVSKLKEQIKDLLVKPIREFRKEIRKTWKDTDHNERNSGQLHTAAQTAVSGSEQTAPRSIGGINLSNEKQDEIIRKFFGDQGVDFTKNPEKVEEIKQELEKKVIKLLDGEWHGKDLFDIGHLNGKSVIKINHSHPFISEIYDPIKKMGEQDPTSINGNDAIRLVKRAEVGLDILFMAYAKAESMHRDPDSVYDDLRTYWGQFTHSYVRSMLKSEE